jgi:hypothetical protein
MPGKQHITGVNDFFLTAGDLFLRPRPDKTHINFLGVYFTHDSPKNQGK